MQILEWSVMGLRAARITLVSPQSDIVITLFPMVHLAEPSFFKAVYDDAFAHDVTLVEGVKSPFSLRITRVYRWAASSRRLALAVQPPWPDVGAVRARIVHADLSDTEFGSAWETIPWRLRWFVYVVAPSVGLWLRLFGDRGSIGRRLAMDDQPSLERAMAWSPDTEAFDGALLGARDARLVQRLVEVLDAPGGQIRRVAVVWGAAHVPAILRAVTSQRGYFAERGVWLTAFTP